MSLPDLFVELFETESNCVASEAIGVGRHIKRLENALSVSASCWAAAEHDAPHLAAMHLDQIRRDAAEHKALTAETRGLWAERRRLERAA